MRRSANRGDHDIPVSSKPRAGCYGKRQYPDHDKADKMAAATRRHRHCKVAPYRCMACGCWHVGEAGDTTPRK